MAYHPAFGMLRETNFASKPSSVIRNIISQNNLHRCNDAVTFEEVADSIFWPITYLGNTAVAETYLMISHYPTLLRLRICLPWPNKTHFENIYRIFQNWHYFSCKLKILSSYVGPLKCCLFVHTCHTAIRQSNAIFQTTRQVTSLPGIGLNSDRVHDVRTYRQRNGTWRCAVLPAY